tara:strand:+ start:797 stop:3202 length:2406 start_codon:yes stop_codon:yes gene_type:complete
MIGVSLAMGLVQGFQNNIAKEEAKRLGEDQRIDAVEDMLLKAQLEGGEDYNAAAGNKLTELIASARTEAKNRKPIDIWGTKTDDIDIDVSKVQGLINEIGDTNHLNIGTYLLPVPKLYFKQQDDPSAKATIFFDAIADQINTEEKKAAFEKEFDPTSGNYTELKKLVKTNAGNLIRSLQKGPEQGDPLAIDLNAIRNYEYLSNYLGLNTDREQDLLIGNVLESVADNDVKASEMLLVSPRVGSAGSMFDMLTKEEFKGKYGILYKDTFIKRDIDLKVVDDLAQSQGVSTNLFMYNLSQKHENREQFLDAVGHLANLYDITRQGSTKGSMAIDFTNNAVKVGEYLEQNVVDGKQQILLIEGLTGSILSENERNLLAVNVKNPDMFRVGKNKEEAFKAVYGSSFEGFQRRLQAAESADKKLAIYATIVGTKISTVKGTLLDSAVNLIEGFFGPSGQVEQLMDILGSFGPDEQDEKAIIQARLEALRASGTGERAKRDTLAFIIAADMARAEDSSGRLSDGDLQRNLQKLTGGAGTKVGEVRSIDIVRDTIRFQRENLSNLNMLILSKGQRGFDVELQERIRALQVRDAVVRSYNQTLQPETEIQPQDAAPVLPTAEDLIVSRDENGLITTTTGAAAVGFNPETEDTYIMRIDGDGNPVYYKVDSDGTVTVVDSEEAGSYTTPSTVQVEPPKKITPQQNQQTAPQQNQQTAPQQNQQTAPSPNVDDITSGDFSGQARTEPLLELEPDQPGGGRAQQEVQPQMLESDYFGRTKSLPNGNIIIDDDDSTQYKRQEIGGKVYLVPVM